MFIFFVLLSFPFFSLHWLVTVLLMDWGGCVPPSHRRLLDLVIPQVERGVSAGLFSLDDLVNLSRSLVRMRFMHYPTLLAIIPSVLSSHDCLDIRQLSHLAWSFTSTAHLRHHPLVVDMLLGLSVRASSLIGSSSSVLPVDLLCRFVVSLARASVISSGSFLLSLVDMVDFSSLGDRHKTDLLRSIAKLSPSVPSLPCFPLLLDHSLDDPFLLSSFVSSLATISVCCPSFSFSVAQDRLISDVFSLPFSSSPRGSWSQTDLSTLAYAHALISSSSRESGGCSLPPLSPECIAARSLHRPPEEDADASGLLRIARIIHPHVATDIYVGPHLLEGVAFPHKKVTVEVAGKSCYIHTSDMNVQLNGFHHAETRWLERMGWIKIYITERVWCSLEEDSDRVALLNAKISRY